MKRNFLSSLTAIFLALAIALAGVTVPRLLIRQQTDRLTNKSELLSSDQLTPYSAGVDSPVRIQKLANMATAVLSTYANADLYLGLREPLDTELTQEAAIQKASAFLADMLETAEGMGLYPLVNPNYYGDYMAEDAVAYAHEYFISEWTAFQEQDKTLADLLALYVFEGQFWVSPEDSSLAMWCLSFDCPYCGCYILIDAVTGIPILLVFGSTGYFSGDEYIFAVIHAYRALFPDRFSDFGSDVTQSFESGISGAQDFESSVSVVGNEAKEAYGYDSAVVSEAGMVNYYSTSSGDVTLELQLIYQDGVWYTPIFRLYA